MIMLNLILSLYVDHVLDQYTETRLKGKVVLFGYAMN